MTAKEMFKKLGYEENNDRETTLRYTTKGFVGQTVEIRFYFYDKSVVKEDEESDIAYLITLEELQAINKQVEELGWEVNK